MTPARFRVIVSTVLAVGVGLSAVLIAIGFLASFAVGWEGSLVGASGPAGAPTDFSTLVAGLLALRPVAIVQAGLVVLLATPVARVATSAVAFTLERDRLYTAITLVVLTVLLVSIFGVR